MQVPAHLSLGAIAAADLQPALPGARPLMRWGCFPAIHLASPPRRVRGALNLRADRSRHEAPHRLPTSAARPTARSKVRVTFRNLAPGSASAPGRAVWPTADSAWKALATSSEHSGRATSRGGDSWRSLSVAGEASATPLGVLIIQFCAGRVRRNPAGRLCELRVCSGPAGRPRPGREHNYVVRRWLKRLEPPSGRCGDGVSRLARSSRCYWDRDARHVGPAGRLSIGSGSVAICWPWF
jgi:hypothetical protein